MQGSLLRGIKLKYPRIHNLKQLSGLSLLQLTLQRTLCQWMKTHSASDITDTLLKYQLVVFFCLQNSQF